MSTYGRSLMVIAMALAMPTWAADAVRAAGSDDLVKVEVFPPNVHLNTSRDRQSLIVVATREDGVTLDVTQQANWKLANAKLARLDGNTLYPLADGDTSLEITYADFNVRVPVSVHEAKDDRAVSFKLDVMPVFMRAGCNTGSCHGAARGKDGFMLSIFGYDPDGDHFRLTQELGFRRINLALPAESMLLEKTDGSVPHTGGKLLPRESEYYQTVLRWIEAGANNDVGEVPKVIRIEVYPPQAVLEGEKASQQMTVRAVYTDGTDRDVTHLAVFMSSNDNAAAVSPDGLITAANRGEAFVMARFDTHTVGGQVMVLPKDLQYSPPSETPVNYIDELVDQKLRKLRILPSETCSDEEFLRRATIDIAGVLPTEEEFLEFTNDNRPDKRARLIDRLLDRPEFAQIWAMKWADVLKVRTNGNTAYNKSMLKYHEWLTEQFGKHVPLDEIVRELLACDGGSFENPAASFYQVERNNLQTAENTAQLFMGIRTQCAQCHNHPFDRWTMDDYYGFAAFFAQVGRKTGEDYREMVVYDRGSGETTHPVTRKRMEPKFLGGVTPTIEGQDRRKVLADWLTSNDNPLFAGSMANRIWEHFFGLGIVNEVDDIRVSNPASNPELFDTLGQKLASYKFDMRRLVRDICLSNTYQRTTVRNASNEHDDINFAHATVRRISAQSLLDCISQVTEAPEKFRGLPLGSRAVQVADASTGNYFLDTFGRSPRATVCACDATTEPTLSQSLHLLNGPTIEGKIQRGAVIKRLLDQGKQPSEVIETIYIRCLTRRPTETELQRLLDVVDEAEDAQKGLEDIFWAVLNSREFIFNH